MTGWLFGIEYIHTYTHILFHHHNFGISESKTFLILNIAASDHIEMDQTPLPCKPLVHGQLHVNECVRIQDLQELKVTCSLYSSPHWVPIKNSRKLSIALLLDRLLQPQIPPVISIHYVDAYYKQIGVKTTGNNKTKAQTATGQKMAAIASKQNAKETVTV